MTSSHEYIGRRGGFAVLGAIVVFAAAWLGTRGVAALKPNKPMLPALRQSADLQRFSAESWFLPNDDWLGFVEVPAGKFKMGSDPRIDRFAFENERWSESSFQGEVDLPTYYIGRYEVTVAQFHAFAVASGVPVSPASLDSEPTYPVVNISWADAVAYARWLDASLKSAPQTPARLRELLNSGWHISLPTEAQWEKAARSDDGRIYPWGNAASRANANFGSSSLVPVGSKRCDECAYGLADFSGNAWEMTLSPNRPYPFEDRQSTDLTADALFVMRGGSFSDNENTVRAAIRGGIDPGARREFVGFRLAMVH